jgi:predicted O-methyltransferase YrrM
MFQFLNFYRTAVTKYQLHSPFVFVLSAVVLERHRWYYAFRDIEAMHDKMLKRDGVLLGFCSRLRSSTGKKLFRLVQWLNPGTVLQLGVSEGMESLYLLAGTGGLTRTLLLEESDEKAGKAQVKVDLMGFQDRVEIRVGDCGQTLPAALKALKKIDFVCIEAAESPQKMVEYFEQCVPFAHETTVFAFTSAHRSAMSEAGWRAIKRHGRVTLTVDYFGISLVFINPDFRVQQHFKVVASSWKVWKIL